jgi:hypothetical protein
MQTCIQHDRDRMTDRRPAMIVSYHSIGYGSKGPSSRSAWPAPLWLSALSSGCTASLLLLPVDFFPSLDDQEVKLVIYP